MSGLFVQKHVEAVRAQGCEVRVIHSQGWRDLWHQWRALRREGWIPDLVQLNILQKQGVLALWLKRRYRIPFIVVEHWSGYLPENGQFQQMSAFKKGLLRRVAAKAEQVLTVSMPLQKAMQQCGIEAKKWGTIDNVVDDFFFQNTGIPERRKTDKKILLHVSCFDERAKNVKGLLRAAKMLSEKRQDWRLVLVGTGIDYNEVRAYAETLDIPKELLVWTYELTPREVAEQMHKSDAFVLCSRYETYGIVMAEAAAAGLPVLSTPVGIAEELNALIVPQEIAQNKPGTFAEFMEGILFSELSDPSDQSEYAERFSADFIGKNLKAVYDSCLHCDI